MGKIKLILFFLLFCFSVTLPSNAIDESTATPVALAEPDLLWRKSNVWDNPAWSPNGKYVAIPDFDRDILVFEALTAKRVKTFSGLSDVVTYVNWSPDSSQIAASDLVDRIIVWDFETGEQITALRTGTQVDEFAWSPDGRFLASTGATYLRVWDTKNWKLLTTLSVGGFFTGIAWSPDNLYLAYEDYKTLRIVDTENWEQQAHKVMPEPITDLDWSPDGQFIATAAGAEGLVYVYDPRTWETVHKFQEHFGMVWHVAWSPGGRYLASLGEDNLIYIWDTTTGNLIHSIEGDGYHPQRVEWSPDGQYIVTDLDEFSVWRIPLPEEDKLEPTATPTITPTATLTPTATVTFTPSPTATPSATPIITEPRQIWSKSNNTTNHPIWSPDGNYIAHANSHYEIEILEALTGKWVKSFYGLSEAVDYINWSPDGSQIAAADDANRVIVWDFETAEQLITLRTGGTPDEIAWSPNGQYFASVAPEHLRVWDADTWQEETDLNVTWFSALAWSPEQRWLAYDTDSSIRIIDVGTWEQAAHIYIEEDIKDIDWSPDGQFIATATGGDGIIYIHDVYTAQQIYLLQEHFGIVTHVDWSPNGDYLASIADDSTIHIWDIQTGDSLYKIEGKGYFPQSVQWSPDGRYIVTDLDGISVWEIPLPKETDN